MSNIIKEKGNLLMFKDILNHFQNNELTKTYLEDVLKNLLPSDNGKLLVDYNVSEQGFATARFVPYTKSINMSLNKINIWLKNNTDDLIKDFKSSDYNVLRSYMLLFMITHEIEHAYQYLMGEGVIEVPVTMLKDAYKGLFELFIPKDYIIPKPIKQAKQLLSLKLYGFKKNLYLLERNANIESTDLISKCALYDNREDIYQLFTDMKNAYSKCGYLKSTIGSIEETYRQILMYDKYKKFDHTVEMTEDERVRYGLSITQETRRKILSKSIQTKQS